MIRYISLLLILFASLNTQAQVDKIIGKWNTIDDKTGEPKGVVAIYHDDDGYYKGKITNLYEKNDQGKFVIMKEYSRELEKVIGMIILKDMKEKDNGLKGQCYDPESGNTYYGRITYDAEHDQLILRGSIDKWGLLGRSQTWIRHQE